MMIIIKTWTLSGHSKLCCLWTGEKLIEPQFFLKLFDGSLLNIVFCACCSVRLTAVLCFAVILRSIDQISARTDSHTAEKSTFGQERNEIWSFNEQQQKLHLCLSFHFFSAYQLQCSAQQQQQQHFYQSLYLVSALRRRCPRIDKQSFIIALFLAPAWAHTTISHKQHNVDLVALAVVIFLNWFH